MKYSRNILFLTLLTTIALEAPARASEFVVGVDGNIFAPNLKTNDLSARFGINSAIDITLFSSQFDWRLGISGLSTSSGQSTLIMYGGPQFRFLPQTDTPYLGFALGLGRTKTLEQKDFVTSFVETFFPFRATAWAGYRFSGFEWCNSQSIEIYTNAGDSSVIGLRYNLHFY
jgi:hypothetical protein